MNRKFIYWIIGILAVAALLVIIWFAAVNGNKSSEEENAAAYGKEQDEIMADMMEDMADVDKSGSASVDFLEGMIPHHESAVEMAESYLKYGGKEEELKKLANDIIKTQKAEIKQMEAMKDKLEKNGAKDSDMENAYLEEYNRMFSGSHAGHAGHGSRQESYSSVEKAFAEGMIMHHQMAVDMAESILNYSDDEEVITLAKGMLDVQNQEIIQMQEILKR